MFVSGLGVLTCLNPQAQMAKDKGAWAGQPHSAASAPKGPGAAVPTHTYTSTHFLVTGTRRVSV